MTTTIPAYIERHFVCYTARVLAEIRWEWGPKDPQGPYISMQTWDGESIPNREWVTKLRIPLADPECFNKVMDFCYGHCPGVFKKWGKRKRE